MPVPAAMTAQGANPRYAALYFNAYEEDVGSEGGGCRYPASPERDPGWVSAFNLSFVNISALVNASQLAGREAGCFLCTPGAPCTGFRFENVSVTTMGGTGAAAGPYTCQNVLGASADGLSVPMPCA